MKKYRAKFDKIYPVHLNAWKSLFGESDLVQITQEDLNKLYHEKFHAILVHTPNSKANKRYSYIEFDSKEHYVLYMMEWA